MNVKIIADSKNSCGNRLTTFVLDYPRFVHAELMTHRVFSRNAASSRAIPIEKFIKQVEENPAMPSHWGKNQKGMQAHGELNNSNLVFVNSMGLLCEDVDSLTFCRQMGELDFAKDIWLKARDAAVFYAKQLNEVGVHKQITNRILEPWFRIKVIVSATDFENWFALRAHDDAHPDIGELAYEMLDEYNKSTPKFLKVGEWHIPFGDSIDEEKIMSIKTWSELTNGAAHEYAGDTKDFIDEIKRKIAIARCARVSYFNYEGKDDYEADIKLCDRLFKNTPKHLSPTEHVAQALGEPKMIGNFRGFKQYRKFFEDENLKDDRVIKK